MTFHKAPCQASSPSSEITEIPTFLSRNTISNSHIGKATYTYFFSWFSEADELFQKTLSLRQVDSTGLLNGASVQIYRQTVTGFMAETVCTPSAVKHT